MEIDQRAKGVDQTEVALIEQVLHTYGIEDYTYQFIRHNENLVYQIAALEKEYLLRIHSPKTSGFRGLQQQRRAIESELQWILALGRDIEEIRFQQPLLNRQGEYVTMISGQILPIPESGEVACTLLSWIKGEHFTPKMEDVGSLATQIGQLQQKLQHHTQRWQVPEDLLRLTYDQELMRQILRDLKEGVNLGVVSPEDYELIRPAGVRIIEIFETMRWTAENWGLIHADLFGNIIVHDQGVSPIDFSLSGFGPYLLDIAVALSNFKPEFREQYLAGFGREFSSEEKYLIGAYIIMMILMAASRNLENPEWAKWMQNRLPRIAQEYCVKLVQGEEFLMEI